MNVLEAIGSGVIKGLAYVGGLTLQFWSELRASPHVLPVVGKRGRWKTAMRQMAAIGVDGLPIIAIMSVCAGFILAMQTGSELRRLGALQYVMDVVGIIPCLTIMSNAFGILAGSVCTCARGTC